MFGQIRTLAASLALAATVAGCSSPPPAQSIDISDDGAFQPGLRGSVSLSRLRGPVLGFELMF